MPKLQWEHLPREKWTHLRDRAKERKISQEDLLALAEWKSQDPDVPDGEWYKDFGRLNFVAKGTCPALFSYAARQHAVSASRFTELGQHGIES
jgi:hypothetical protein